MSEPGLKPSGYIVLGSEVPVGTARWSGVGIGSLPPEEAALMRPVVAAMDLAPTLATSRSVKTVAVAARLRRME